MILIYVLIGYLPKANLVRLLASIEALEESFIQAEEAAEISQDRRLLSDLISKA